MTDKKTPKKPKRNPSLKTVPSFECKFTYESAACLYHLISSQRIHAKSLEEQGFPALKESVNTLTPFFNALSEYVNKYS